MSNMFKVKIHLIVNWKELYLNLWSNRLMLAAALLSGGEAAMQIFAGGDVWYALLIFMISFSATIARMISQPATVEKAAEKALAKELVNDAA